MFNFVRWNSIKTLKDFMESIDNKNYAQTLKDRHERKKYKVTETAFSFRCSFIKVWRRKSKFRLKRIVTQWTRIKKNNLSVNLVALNHYVCIDIRHVVQTRFSNRIQNPFGIQNTEKSKWKKFFFRQWR